jgi:hypothetical protein
MMRRKPKVFSITIEQRIRQGNQHQLKNAGTAAYYIREIVCIRKKGGALPKGVQPTQK